MHFIRPYLVVTFIVLCFGFCGPIGASPPDWNDDNRVDHFDALALVLAASYEQATTDDFWLMAQAWYRHLAPTATPTPSPTASPTPSPTLIVPQVIFNVVPRYGTTDTLIRGRIVNLSNPQQYVLGLVLKVGDGWWSKPYASPRVISIKANGTWESINIFNQLNDRYATEIAAYVVPVGQLPPLHLGDSSLQSDPNAVAIGRYVREPGKIVSFAGLQWQTKQRDVQAGPKALAKVHKSAKYNYYSDHDENVWVDDDGLHLQITKRNGRWWAAEVWAIEPFNSFGTIEFSVAARPDLFSPQVVFGGFSWEIESDVQSNRELDIEYGQLGANDSNQAQYVVQPCGNCLFCGRCERFQIPAATTNEVTHRIVWQPDTATFATFRDRWVGLLAPLDTQLHGWTFPGLIDEPGRAQMRFNLWLIDGQPPADGQPIEVVITDYRFTLE